MHHHRKPAVLRLAARLAAVTLLLTAAICATAQDHPRSAAAIARELADPARLQHLGPDADTVLDFYRQRDFAPAWHAGPAGEPTGRAEALRQAIAASTAHGLDPKSYHYPELQRLWTSTEPRDRAVLDILLTDALARYAAHLNQGRIAPATADQEWHIPVAKLNVAQFLAEAVASADPVAALDRLLPANPGYRGLQAALERYRVLAAGGGWPTVPAGPTLHPGDRDRRVTALRKRLQAEGFAIPAVQDSQLYDEGLEPVVRQFQRLHTLADDGLVGRRTLAALNMPATARAAQIQANLERWRWLPRHLEQRHVLVNAAAFELKAYDSGEPRLTMRVIIGRPLRSTPAFAGTLTGININPYWNTPESIARKDIVPHQIEDPDYLRSRNIRIFESWSPNAAELQPEQIDWVALRGKRFPYHLRQEPGPKNALGRIKFLSSNDFSIYLHDTPDRELFQREVRTFSSGCIRVQTAEDLALWLFEGIEGWTRDYLHALIDSEETLQIPLPRPVPLYLVYLTAWVDDASGELHFADDVYSRDGELAAGLGAGDCGPPAGKVN